MGRLPGTILMLMPDEVRLRHARRLLARTPAPAHFALEREAVIAEPDDPVWQMRSINADVSLRSAIDRMDRRGALPVERPLARASLPPDTDERASGGDSPDYLLPALLKPAEKRTLDLLADWPWLDLRDLAGLLGVSRSRASQIVAAIEGFGLVVRAPILGPPPGYHRSQVLRCWPAGTAPPWAGPGNDGVPPLRAPETGVRFQAGAAANCCATWNTPRRYMVSWRALQGRPEPWDGRSPNWTLPSGPRAISGSLAACARYTLTPSAFCKGATPNGPFSWSGNGAQCGRSQWRRASPPTCATIPPTGPSTTTAHGPRCW